ncbi:SigE family RNA polymerase sigma factor [Micromonospora ureilytica]|uniref:SigE family RNA polymerase sigma factor n=1 Tax=Micromonospora ureilytica TaxID=709868 RepID=A0A3N9Y1F6_9ACTN|nr:SigE family RNA polymerase sigma factor [Micromonospora ureilytica]RQX19118.1 SigE family RNA polymerase sigma factor [Micromonospora ureilytica]
MTNGVDEVEFEGFVRSIQYWLRREAYDICGDWYEAEDLVQATLFSVYQRWNRLDRRTGLGAYAHRVLVRTFLTERRRPRWRHESTTMSITATDILLAPASHTAVDDRRSLLPVLQRLGPRQRAVIALRFFGDLSVTQTAQVLGCTTGTVTSQTVRALKALRRDLESRPPPRAACDAQPCVYVATFIDG